MGDNKELQRQGVHPDPEDPAIPRPDPATWPPRQRAAWTSDEMDRFRDALRTEPGAPVRDSVLDDLAIHFDLTPDECRQRCLHWEDWSVREWADGDRSTREGLSDFYRKVQSWAFDLLWHAYLQAEGLRYPVSVAVVRSLDRRTPGRVLDFGAGAGVTAQLFARMGWKVDLADVSSSLLAFARHRLERRGVDAGYLDLNEVEVPVDEYDVVTAIDTLAHVPDLPEAARTLHRSLRPGGVLFTNFDVRPATAENSWHLYTDDLPLRYALHRTGFDPAESLDGQLVRYRRVTPAGPAHALRGLRDLVALRSPLRPTVRRLRRAIRPGG
jgi:SAM-dependent methyltransferase